MGKAVFRHSGIVFWLCLLFWSAGTGFAWAVKPAATSSAASAQTVLLSESSATAPAAAPPASQNRPESMGIEPVPPQEVTELWTGGLYTSTYRVGICYSALGKVRGVLHLRLADGKVDVYHFYGSIKNNRLEVSHGSGHSFKGRLLGGEKVEGTIRLKSGMKIVLEGKRLPNAPLVMEDCAPLPE